MQNSRAILAAIVLALALGRGHATTFVNLNEHVLARAADAVVIGTVERLQSVVDPEGMIATLVTVDVEQTLKGQVGKRITLKQPGGQVGGRGFWIAASPVFRSGERNLLFLSARRDGTAATTALGMGQFRLVPRSTTGEIMAERQLRGAMLGGNRILRRVTLKRLIRTIARGVAADAGRSLTPLVAEPAEVRDPGLERGTVEAFTLMDGPHGRWFEADTGTPVAYHPAPDGDAGLGVDSTFGALDDAMRAWSSVSGSSIVLQRGAPAAAAPLRCDGISQIVFNDPFHEMPNPVSCAGILALGGFCTSSAHEAVNGVTFYHITEGNITFNNGFSGCSFWNQSNVAEVLTHELGHTIGIGHSSEDDNPVAELKDATMYYRAHFDGRGASVHADDVRAVRFIYAGEGGGDGPPDDLDADGLVDDADNCPDIANVAQIDSDGDGVGDLCDPCPLTADESCLAIMPSKLVGTLGATRSRLSWRGAILLDPATDPSQARVLLVSGQGILLDAASPESADSGAGLPGHLHYKNEQTNITLSRRPYGLYKVRVRARDVDLDDGELPLLSASLQVGSSSFAISLSCSRSASGRRLICRS